MDIVVDKYYLSIQLKSSYLTLWKCSVFMQISAEQMLPFGIVLIFCGHAGRLDELRCIFVGSYIGTF